MSPYWGESCAQSRAQQCSINYLNPHVTLWSYGGIINLNFVLILIIADIFKVYHENYGYTPSISNPPCSLHKGCSSSQILIKALCTWAFLGHSVYNFIVCLFVVILSPISNFSLYIPHPPLSPFMHSGSSHLFAGRQVSKLETEPWIPTVSTAQWIQHIVCVVCVINLMVF